MTREGRGSVSQQSSFYWLQSLSFYANLKHDRFPSFSANWYIFDSWMRKLNFSFPKYTQRTSAQHELAISKVAHEKIFKESENIYASKRTSDDNPISSCFYFSLCSSFPPPAQERKWVVVIFFYLPWIAPSSLIPIPCARAPANSNRDLFFRYLFPSSHSTLPRLTVECISLDMTRILRYHDNFSSSHIFIFFCVCASRVVFTVKRCFLMENRLNTFFLCASCDWCRGERAPRRCSKIRCRCASWVGGRMLVAMKGKNKAK